MKKLLVIFLLFLCVSCNNNTSVKQEEASITKEEKSSEINKQEPITIGDWEKFEEEVFQCMEAIQTSDENNRREYIEKFVSYSQKVDGAISEAYSNFAFEYADTSCADLFKSLTIKDTLLIDIWAKAASSEVIIIAENQEPEFMEIFAKRFTSKISKLPSDKQQIAQYYLDKLNQYSHE